jgi:peptidase E
MPTATHTYYMTTLFLVLLSVSTILIAYFSKVASAAVLTGANMVNDVNTCNQDTGRHTSPPIARLLLTSSGVVDETMRHAWDRLYLAAQRDTGHTKVAYVPDAATMGELVDVTGYAAHVSRQLGLKLGDLRILEVSALVDADESSSARSLLKDVAAVYIEQGNTYYVTYQVRRSGLDGAILDLVNRGGLYAGASAGAILAGATIRTCEWKNWDDPGHGTSWDLRATKHGLDGLGMMDGGASLFPHAGPEWVGRVEEMKVRHTETVVILDEVHCWVQDEDGGALLP